MEEDHKRPHKHDKQALQQRASTGETREGEEREREERNAKAEYVMTASGERKRRKSKTRDSTKRAKQPTERAKGRHKEPQATFTWYDRREQGPIGTRGRENEKTEGGGSPQPRHARREPEPRRLCFTENLPSCGKIHRKKKPIPKILVGTTEYIQRIYTDIPDGMASVGDISIPLRGGSRPDCFR